MVAKILAALETRRTDIVIIARTDAIAVEGFDAAVRRARIFAEAGADVVFVEAPVNDTQVRALPDLVAAPLLINMVEGGVTPFSPPDTLEQLGYRIMVFANFGLRNMIKSMSIALSELRKAGTSQSLMEGIVTWEERQALVGLNEYDGRQRDWHQRAVALQRDSDIHGGGELRQE